MTPFLDIGNGWGIAYDPLQWIVCRKADGEKSQWSPISYVGGNKDHLREILMRRGAIERTGATGPVAEFLDAKPYWLKDWVKEQA